MRFISRSAFVALVAVFVMSVVGAASASAALPEFTVETSFAGHGVLSLFETVGGARWNYSGTGLEGAEKKTTVQGVNIMFTGPSTYACTNVTNVKNERELAWKELKGKLGYINKEAGNKKVGMLLEPTKQPIAKCEVPRFAEETDSGTLILEVTPLNTKTTHFTLTAQQYKGEQLVSGFEGADTSSLSVAIGTNPPEEMGLQTTIEVTTTKETEIHA